MQLQPLGVACYTGDMSEFQRRFTFVPCSKSADFFFTKLVLGAAIASSVGPSGEVKQGGAKATAVF